MAVNVLINPKYVTCPSEAKYMLCLAKYLAIIAVYLFILYKGLTMD